MKKLKCAALGSPECKYVATGETDEEVMGKMMDHAKAHHADKMMDMNEDEMKKTMEDKIEEAEEE